MSIRLIALISGCISAFFVGAVAIIFQDNITRFLLNPRTPYQLYTPPPAPSYGARGAWLLWPSDAERGDVDIFYIHSTTYEGRAHWNAPIGEKNADTKLRRVAAPNQAGPFVEIGALYGPRYRQATLFTEFTHKFDGLAARELAYADIENAFAFFLRTRASERPFILVGYGQGGLHGLGLLQNVISDDRDIQPYLVAAYLIDIGVSTHSIQSDTTEIAPCNGSDEVGCIVSFTAMTASTTDESKRLRRRALIFDADDKLLPVSDPPLICVNPLLGNSSNEPALPERHLGAASATGLGLQKRPPAISKAIGAQCVDGVLEIDRPDQAFLRQRHWFGEQWRAKDYNLFYFDLENDAHRRVQAWQNRPLATPTSVDTTGFPQRSVLEQPDLNPAEVDSQRLGDDKDDV